MGAPGESVSGGGRCDENERDGDQRLDAETAEALHKEYPKHDAARAEADALGRGLKSVVNIGQPHQADTSEEVEKNADKDNTKAYVIIHPVVDLPGTSLT